MGSPNSPSDDHKKDDVGRISRPVKRQLSIQAFKAKRSVAVAVASRRVTQFGSPSRSPSPSRGGQARRTMRHHGRRVAAGVGLARHAKKQHGLDTHKQRMSLSLAEASRRADEAEKKLKDRKKRELESSFKVAVSMKLKLKGAREAIEKRRVLKERELKREARERERMAVADAEHEVIRAAERAVRKKERAREARAESGRRLRERQAAKAEAARRESAAATSKRAEADERAAMAAADQRALARQKRERAARARAFNEERARESRDKRDAALRRLANSGLSPEQLLKMVAPEDAAALLEMLLAQGDISPADVFRLDPRYSAFDADGIPTHDADGNPLSDEERARLRAKMVAMGGLPADQLFRGDPRFSRWDADGVPTHDADGNPLSEEARAKLRAQLVAAGGLAPEKLFLGDPRYSRFDADGVPTHDADGNPLSEEARARLRMQMIAAGGLAPEKMFLNDPRFSRWDADGVPTHDADGNPLSEAERARLRAQMLAAKLLAEGRDPLDYTSMTHLYSRFDADGVPTHDAFGNPLSEAERAALRAALLDARGAAALFPPSPLSEAARDAIAERARCEAMREEAARRARSARRSRDRAADEARRRRERAALLLDPFHNNPKDVSDGANVLDVAAPPRAALLEGRWASARAPSALALSPSSSALVPAEAAALAPATPALRRSATTSARFILSHSPSSRELARRPTSAPAWGDRSGDSFSTVRTPPRSRPKSAYSALSIERSTRATSVIAVERARPASALAAARARREDLAASIPAGQSLDRAFADEWRLRLSYPPWSGSRSGPRPASAPAARRLADDWSFASSAASAASPGGRRRGAADERSVASSAGSIGALLRNSTDDELARISLDES